MVTTNRTASFHVAVSVEGNEELDQLANKTDEVGDSAKSSATSTDSLTGSVGSLTSGMLRGVVIGTLLGGALGFLTGQAKEAFSASLAGSEAMLRLGDASNNVARELFNLLGVDDLLSDIADEGDRLARVLADVAANGLTVANTGALFSIGVNTVGVSRPDPDAPPGPGNPILPNILHEPYQGLINTLQIPEGGYIGALVDRLSESTGLPLNTPATESFDGTVYGSVLQGLQELEDRNFINFSSVSLPDFLRPGNNTDFTNEQPNEAITAPQYNNLQVAPNNPDIQNNLQVPAPGVPQQFAVPQFAVPQFVPAPAVQPVTAPQPFIGPQPVRTPNQPTGNIATGGGNITYSVTNHFNGTVVDDAGLDDRIIRTVDRHFRNPSTRPSFGGLD